MAVTIKTTRVPRPPPASLLRDVRGVARGLGATFLQAFRRPAVVHTRPPGSLRLLFESDGSTRCVACGICTKNCPSACLTVEAEETREAGARGEGIVTLRPRRFEVDQLRCTGCARCVQVCPERVLDLGGPPAPPVVHRAEAIVELLRRQDPDGLDQGQIDLHPR